VLPAREPVARPADLGTGYRCPAAAGGIPLGGKTRTLRLAAAGTRR